MILLIKCAGKQEKIPNVAEVFFLDFSSPDNCMPLCTSLVTVFI